VLPLQHFLSLTAEPTDSEQCSENNVKTYKLFVNNTTKNCFSANNTFSGHAAGILS
jgi:hypothetical protein